MRLKSPCLAITPTRLSLAPQETCPLESEDWPDERQGACPLKRGLAYDTMRSLSIGEKLDPVTRCQ